MQNFVYHTDFSVLENNKYTYHLLLPNIKGIKDISMNPLRVWIICWKNNKNFVQACLHADKIEAPEHEAERFILTASIDRSYYYFGSLEQDLSKYNSNCIFSRKQELEMFSFIDTKIAERLEIIIHNNVKFNFNPDRNAISRLNEEIIAEDINVLNLYRITKRIFPVILLNRNPRRKEWDEYQNLVYDFLESKGSQDMESIKLQIDSIDSLLLKISEKNIVVDLNLQLLDTRTISGRKYNEPGLLKNSELTVMESIEKAEKRHQEILKDVASFLQENNQTVYETNSIDLLSIKNGSYSIFEIKSSNNENYSHQCEKALAQILRYDYALYKEGIKVIGRYLIIEKSIHKNITKFMQGLYEYCGLGFLIYDSAKGWPERVEGLLQIVQSP